MGLKEVTISSLRGVYVHTIELHGALEVVTAVKEVSQSPLALEHCTPPGICQNKGSKFPNMKYIPQPYKGPKYPNVGCVHYMASLLGVVTVVLGIYSVFRYLDP